MNLRCFPIWSGTERGNIPCGRCPDALTISGGEISRCLEQLTAKHWITQDGDALAVTDAGLAALEPYRVKRAIILAAGFGSRMMPATADRPKPLVTVNGVRILKRCWTHWWRLGFGTSPWCGATGRNALTRCWKSTPFLTLVDNDIYSKTNNISSVMAGLNKLDGCYLCEADLYITNPGIITKYQYASNILGAYCLETDDWSFQMDAAGHIINYQKGKHLLLQLLWHFLLDASGQCPPAGRTSGRSMGRTAEKTTSGNSSPGAPEGALCRGNSPVPEVGHHGDRQLLRACAAGFHLPNGEDAMKCYEGHILTVNQNNDVARYLVEDGEKSYTWETTCQNSTAPPRSFNWVKKPSYSRLCGRTPALCLLLHFPRGSERHGRGVQRRDHGDGEAVRGAVSLRKR